MQVLTQADRDAWKARLRTHEVRTGEAALTVDEWLCLLVTCGFRCARCGSDDALVIAHLIPLSRGGTHTIDNVAPLCAPCNQSMFCRTPLEWIAGISIRRPKQDVTKDARIDVRMHAALRDALEELARREGRTLSRLCERYLRQFAIEYLKENGGDVKSLERLP